MTESQWSPKRKRQLVIGAIALAAAAGATGARGGEPARARASRFVPVGAQPTLAEPTAAEARSRTGRPAAPAPIPASSGLVYDVVPAHSQIAAHFPNVEQASPLAPQPQSSKRITKPKKSAHPAGIVEHRGSTATATSAMPASAMAPSAEGGARRAPNQGLEYRPPPAPEPLDIGSLLLRMTIGTVTVLGVGVVGVLTARRWMPQGMPGGPGKRMTLEESLALGKRCRVHLISVASERLVVVMDGAGVKAVEVLREPFPDVESWGEENAVAPGGPAPPGATIGREGLESLAAQEPERP